MGLKWRPIKRQGPFRHAQKWAVSCQRRFSTPPRRTLALGLLPCAASSHHRWRRPELRRLGRRTFPGTGSPAGPSPRPWIRLRYCNCCWMWKKVRSFWSDCWRSLLQGDGEVYAFGPYNIDAKEVFYSTHLSYAFVNLRPLLPGLRNFPLFFFVIFMVWIDVGKKRKRFDPEMNCCLLCWG